METTPQPQEKKSKSSLIFLILSVLFFLVSGLLGFLLYTQKQQTAQVTIERNNLSQEKDSLSLELQDLLGKYATMEKENGSLSAELQAERDKVIELQKQVDKLRASGDGAKVAKYKKELDGMKTRFAELEAQVAALKVENSGLKAENTQVKQVVEEKKQEVEKLSGENTQLSNKVALGSLLKAYGIKAEPVKGSKEKITNKAKRVEKVRVCFTLSENKITKAGSKDLYIRIESPDGKVLSKDASDEITVNGEKKQFSVKKEIMYENSQMDICIYYNKSDNFSKGQYNVQIFADQTNIGGGSFELK
jgi:chromosome segregation ATPase